MDDGSIDSMAYDGAEQLLRRFSPLRHVDQAVRMTQGLCRQDVLRKLCFARARLRPSFDEWPVHQSPGILAYCAGHVCGLSSLSTLLLVRRLQPERMFCFMIIWPFQ